MRGFLFCDSSAYISEFLTYNNGPIVYLMCLYLEQASKGAGLEFLAFNKAPIVFLMVLYMKQGGFTPGGTHGTPPPALA